MNATAGWNWNNVSDTYWSVPSADVYFFLHRWRDCGLRGLLDLGCGIGRHSLLFSEYGYRVTAADVSDSGLRRLRAGALGFRPSTTILGTEGQRGRNILNLFW